MNESLFHRNGWFADEPPMSPEEEILKTGFARSRLFVADRMPCRPSTVSCDEKVTKSTVRSHLFVFKMNQKKV